MGRRPQDIDKIVLDLIMNEDGNTKKNPGEEDFWPRL